MRKFSILLFTLSIFLISCNENRIFESHTDPSGNLEWNKDEVVEFTVEIEDTSIEYNEILALRYAQGFAAYELPVQVTRTSPDGTEEVYQHSFQPRNQDGSYIGDVAGDIWDLEEVMHSNIKFPMAGKYNYRIVHLHIRPKQHMVMEVGLIVDKIPTPQ